MNDDNIFCLQFNGLWGAVSAKYVIFAEILQEA